MNIVVDIKVIEPDGAEAIYENMRLGVFTGWQRSGAPHVPGLMTCYGRVPTHWRPLPPPPQDILPGTGKNVTS